MRLVFAGTPEPAVPALRALLGSDRHEVVAVVTRPDAEAGRGRRIKRSPIAELADERGIEVLSPRKAGDPDFLARLRELAPDACPVVAYGALLPQTALDIPTHGWVNLHFSILPAWRGAAPVQAALLAGDDIVGASTFQIVRELDAGPVYGVLTERSRPGDTAGELLDRLSHSGAELLVSTLDGIADGTARAVPQPAEGISFAPKVTVEHSRIDFTQSASVVDRLIRSVTPEPGAWANFRGERVKIGPVRTVESAPEVKSAQEIEAASEPATAVEVRLEPGEVRVERRRVLVGTATLPVRLDQVQASGKKRMAATDWARGIRIEQGERFQ